MSETNGTPPAPPGNSTPIQPQGGPVQSQPFVFNPTQAPQAPAAAPPPPQAFSQPPPGSFQQPQQPQQPSWDPRQWQQPAQAPQNFQQAPPAPPPSWPAPQAPAYQPPPQPQAPTQPFVLQPPQAPAQAPATAQRDNLAKQFGIDLSHVGSDADLLPYLAQQAQRASQLGEQYNLAQQALALSGQVLQPAAQQAQRPQETPEQQALRQLWNPPEWNPAWDKMLTKDAQGNLSILPGADPRILAQRHQYDQYRRDFADRLLTNPIDALRPLIEHVANNVARQASQQTVQASQEKTLIDDFLVKNQGWIYQTGPNGQPMNDAQGKVMLSEHGQQLARNLEYLHESGVRESGRLIDAALRMMPQQQQTPQHQVQPGRQFLETMNRRQPSYSGANMAGPAPGPGASFAQVFAHQLSQSRTI